MKEIVIVGAGGLAKEVAFLIDQINHQKKQWNILGFIDSNKNNIGKKMGNILSFLLMIGSSNVQMYYM